MIAPKDPRTLPDLLREAGEQAQRGAGFKPPPHDWGPDGCRSRCALCGTLRDSYMSPCTAMRISLPQGEAVISPGPRSSIIVEPVKVVGGTAQVELRFGERRPEPGQVVDVPMWKGPVWDSIRAAWADAERRRERHLARMVALRRARRRQVSRLATAAGGVAIATAVPTCVGALVFELAGVPPVFAAGIGFAVATALLLVVFRR